VKTGNWIEGRIGAKIVRLTGRWIAVKIDNRIELCIWTVLIDQIARHGQSVRIGQTDLIDQSDRTGRIGPDITSRFLENNAG
jgi:hypothetical protein